MPKSKLKQYECRVYIGVFEVKNAVEWIETRVSNPIFIQSPSREQALEYIKKQKNILVGEEEIIKITAALRSDEFVMEKIGQPSLFDFGKVEI